jgi:predicted RNase H-like nuclease (RuvC/YqgF family)
MLLPPWLQETSEVLSRWEKQGENARDYAALDRIKSEFDVASNAFARIIRGAVAYDRYPTADAPRNKKVEVPVAGFARAGPQASDISTLKSMLQEQRRKATLLNADLHKQIEAREALETQLIEAQAELEASRERRKEMARVITNRDTKIQRLYEELAALQRHVVRSSPLGQAKMAFRRISRALRRPNRQPVSEASSLS